MKYIFGTNRKGKENIKIIDTKHNNYSGSIEFITEYDDTKITDTFEIIKKYYSSEDVEGNCYDWYEIKNHNRIIDKIIREIDVPDDIKNNIIDEYTLSLIEQGVI